MMAEDGPNNPGMELQLEWLEQVGPLYIFFGFGEDNYLSRHVASQLLCLCLILMKASVSSARLVSAWVGKFIQTSACLEPRAKFMYLAKRPG